MKVVIKQCKLLLSGCKLHCSVTFDEDGINAIRSYLVACDSHNIKVLLEEREKKVSKSSLFAYV